MKTYATLTLLIMAFSRMIAQPDQQLFFEQQNALLQLIRKYHYHPPSFQPKEMEEVVDLFMNTLDDSHILFLKEDQKEFYQLVSAGSRPFSALYDAALSKLRLRLQQSDSMLTLIAKKPFVFNGKDTAYIFYKKKSDYTLTSADQYKRLEKRLKLKVSDYLLSPKTEQDKPFEKPDAELMTKEPKAREICSEKWKKKYQKLLSNPALQAKLVSNALLNAISHRCDPHSDFFSPDEKEVFEKALSAESESFGFYVFNEEEENTLIIAHLIPGSSAWRNGELNEEDKVLHIQIGDKEFKEADDPDAEEINDLLDASGSRTLQLTVQKKNGEIKEVKLQKEKIKTEENVFTAFLLKRDQQTIGYIRLPSFYSAFEDESLGCANDVAKEIVKLKSANINGLIIDLRYNGGGSMREAMDLAGIFIDEGPLAICKSRNDKPRLLKDMNRGTIYDGPLLLLVNGSSASASEFFTAAIQDYRRGIIVGATTYGKGTYQSILPLDTSLFSNPYRKSSKIPGFVKLTQGQFYRIKANSHQGTGIQPDIPLPDPFDFLIKRESRLPYALHADSVNKKVVFTPYPEKPLAVLAEESKRRVKDNITFQHLELFGDTLEAMYNKEQAVPLTLANLKRLKRKELGIIKKFDTIYDNPEGVLSVENTDAQSAVLEFDMYQREQNEKNRKEIHDNIYIQESFNILNNYLQTLKK